MRVALLLATVVLLAGCGSTRAAGGRPTPTATPIPHFSHAPKMAIDPNKSYTAIFNTTEGSFRVELLPKVAPIAVNSFVFLARHKYYDHVIFHRVIVGFMVQTGDPTGTGAGGPGYTFKNEPVTLPYTPGVVAMANTGQPNSNGSQFFIVTGSGASSLPKTYTIFGKVTAGMSTVHKIEHTPVQPNPGSNEMSQPVNAPVINKVVIHESG